MRMPQPVILGVAMLAGSALAGCGSGDTAAIPAPSAARGTGAVTKTQAVAYARAVNLRATDLPRMNARSPEHEGKAPTRLELALARCDGELNPLHRVLNRVSPTFTSPTEDGGERESEHEEIHSSVEVLPTPAIAAGHNAAQISPRGLDCIKRFFPAAFAKSDTRRLRYGPVTLQHLPNPLPGVLGSFAVRIATSVLGVPSRDRRDTTTRIHRHPRLPRRRIRNQPHRHRVPRTRRRRSRATPPHNALQSRAREQALSSPKMAVYSPMIRFELRSVQAPMTIRWTQQRAWTRRALTSIVALASACAVLAPGVAFAGGFSAPVRLPRFPEGEYAWSFAVNDRGQALAAADNRVYPVGPTGRLGRPWTFLAADGHPEGITSLALDDQGRVAIGLSYDDLSEVPEIAEHNSTGCWHAAVASWELGTGAPVVQDLEPAGGQTSRNDEAQLGPEVAIGPTALTALWTEGGSSEAHLEEASGAPSGPLHEHQLTSAARGIQAIHLTLSPGGDPLAAWRLDTEEIATVKGSTNGELPNPPPPQKAPGFTQDKEQQQEPPVTGEFSSDPQSDTLFTYLTGTFASHRRSVLAMTSTNGGQFRRPRLLATLGPEANTPTIVTGGNRTLLLFWSCIAEIHACTSTWARRTAIFGPLTAPLEVGAHPEGFIDSHGRTVIAYTRNHGIEAITASQENPSAHHVTSRPHTATATSAPPAKAANRPNPAATAQRSSTTPAKAPNGNTSSATPLKPFASGPTIFGSYQSGEQSAGAHQPRGRDASRQSRRRADAGAPIPRGSREAPHRARPRGVAAPTRDDELQPPRRRREGRKRRKPPGNPMSRSVGFARARTASRHADCDGHCRVIAGAVDVYAHRDVVLAGCLVAMG